jgi:saccharopine dehydrogenase-like NADP-dependent oxidoreductase
MKILVIGSGEVGAASAWDLVRDSEVEIVGIVGRRKSNLERVQKQQYRGYENINARIRRRHYFAT